MSGLGEDGERGEAPVCAGNLSLIVDQNKNTRAAYVSLNQQTPKGNLIGSSDQSNDANS